MPNDPRPDRARVFCEPQVSVFDPVLLGASVWRPDPFDIEGIHERARRTYRRLLDNVASGAADVSKILLLLGAAGSGKTHLVRAFRNQTHADRAGYLTYVQLSSEAPSYPRYILRNVVDSLDKRYAELEPQTGLERLSAHLADDPAAPVDLVARLRDEEAALPDKLDAAREIAETLRDSGRLPDAGVFRPIDALLMLQTGETRVTRRVFQYLRGDRMDERDCQYLGGLLPIDDQDPLWVMDCLAKLIWRLEQRPLIVCFDQLEEVLIGDDSHARALKAVSTVCELASKVAPALIVVTCLEDQYHMIRDRSLIQSYRDRLEQDPAPEHLIENRTADEIRFLLAGRLAYMYEASGAEWSGAEPLYPFPESLPDTLSGLSTRRVLEHCRIHQVRCAQRGAIVPWSPDGTAHEDTAVGDVAQGASAPCDTALPVSAVATDDSAIAMQQAWNDYQSAFAQPAEDDESLAELLSWSARQVHHEIAGASFEPTTLTGRRSASIHLRARAGGEDAGTIVVAVCSKSLRGGGLTNQIAEVIETAAETGSVPVAIRAGAFPTVKSRTALLPKRIRDLVTSGGRRIAAPAAELRTLAALRAFLESRPAGSEAIVAAWRREQRPVSEQTFLREMLDLGAIETRIGKSRQPSPARPTHRPADADDVTQPGEPGAGEPASVREATQVVDTLPPSLPLGVSSGVAAQPLALSVSDLKRHAMVLAGSGSGKTVLVCNILEQLVLRGVPVVLIDRKGDLASYADPDAWETELGAQDLALRERLRRTAHVRLMTPGCAVGDPVSPPILPDGLRELRADQREDQAHFAAATILGLTDARTGQRHSAFLAILKQAILTLAEQTSDELSLDALIELIAQQDPTLFANLSRLDPSHARKLVEALEVARLNNGVLLSDSVARLDLSLLLGPHGGKIPLSVICTKFLSETQAITWIAQLLAAVGRYGSRHPSDELQAVLFFDEADCYLPATTKPATKAPMEDLLKRARSAGIGLILATQSPGDLDYRCRDQISTRIIGRIAEPRAIEKLRPVLADSNIDAGLIARQGVGEFVVATGSDVQRLRGRMSLVRPVQLAEQRIEELAGQPRV